MVNDVHLNNKNKNITNHIVTKWFKKKGWYYYNHQLETLSAVKEKKDVLVISPTGTGKTLSGFLPSFFDLIDEKKNINKFHTLYISPLKSLTYDIERNLLEPIKGFNLNISIQSRTGDTNHIKKHKQLVKPPQILATTIESFVLLMSQTRFKEILNTLKFLVIDEVHSIVNTKRGELLSLNLSRLEVINNNFRKILLSATVSNPKTIMNYFGLNNSKLINSKLNKKTSLKIVEAKKKIPWSGYMADYAIEEIYKIVKENIRSIVFVNTRAQAELLFQNLWKINNHNLKIAIHHGSLEKKLRIKVEENMAKKKIDCIVATSSLDLGLDWLDIKAIIQVGAPKGITRLIQRIGRSNHSLIGESKAFLVPTNRLEFIESFAALEAIKENDLELTNPKKGSLDVLAQHILGVACSGTIDPCILYKEIKNSFPYKHLTKRKFMRVFSFVKDGGYSLKKYKQFSKLKKNKNGLYELSSNKFVRQYRMNVGTIIESQMMTVRLKNKILGKIEEWFIQKLQKGDTFLFGGEILSVENLKFDTVNVKRVKSKIPKIPSYAGGKMPLSTKLAGRVVEILNDTTKWNKLPTDVKKWLFFQRKFSIIPAKGSLLIESFPRKKGDLNEYYYIFYTFEGRNVNETLGFVLSKCIEKKGYKPLGFVTTDYALAIWVDRKINFLKKILTETYIKKNLNEWLKNSSLFRRNFRKVAIISGLLDRGFPNSRKQDLSFNSDIIFEVLMKYEKHHILIEATEEESKKELVEIDRLNSYLNKVKKKIVYKELQKTSPLSIPLIIEFNKEFINKKIIDEYYLDKLEKQILDDAGVA